MIEPAPPLYGCLATSFGDCVAGLVPGLAGIVRLSKAQNIY